MSKKNKLKAKKNLTSQQPVKKTVVRGEKKIALTVLIAVLGITAICFLPMLRNELTNWDDEYYVTQNLLLRGPDWHGIFTQAVVSNYHPLTIITLAFNYALTGLDASSYLILNLILHLINTALVFYFIYAISNYKVNVAAFTALIFGIHPMHVESVAWVSERKDVLYTLFFLLSLMLYWRYLAKGKVSNLVYCFFLFVLSLLSKPAAIILPLVLFALDYWKGRSISKRNILEKIPFLIVSLFFAILTVKIQSKSAITGLDFYPLWTRFFFATYVTMIYILRFFIPYPLSTFHPFPAPSNLGWAVQFSPLFILALLAWIGYKRKNKLIVFSMSFFIINLLLVLQIISVGATIVSERYTYVPYIGLAFLLGMWLDKYWGTPVKSPAWLVPAVATIAFGFMTFKRTQVWKNSGSLWEDVITHYPNEPVPRTNHANYIIHSLDKAPYKDSVNYYLQIALEDCNIAIKANPGHAKGYENRQNVYLRIDRPDLALADANSLIRLQPNNLLGYYTRGVVYVKTNKPDSALADFNKAIEINPNVDYALNNRGSVYLNYFKGYDNAVADFTRAININPQADYYLNRSYAYYNKGDLVNAKADAQTAMNKGKQVPDNYRRAVGLQ